jgi:hypothetical protein
MLRAPCEKWACTRRGVAIDDTVERHIARWAGECSRSNRGAGVAAERVARRVVTTAVAPRTTSERYACWMTSRSSSATARRSEGSRASWASHATLFGHQNESASQGNSRNDCGSPYGNRSFRRGASGIGDRQRIWRACCMWCRTPTSRTDRSLFEYRLGPPTVPNLGSRWMSRGCHEQVPP